MAAMVVRLLPPLCADRRAASLSGGKRRPTVAPRRQAPAGGAASLRHHRPVLSFAALYEALDASTATGDKLAALKRYYAEAGAADAAWATYFLAGGKPRQVVPTAVLRATACRLAGLPDWLFDESYQAVGDLAETIAHVLPPPRASSDLGLAAWVEERLLPLRGLAPEEQMLRLAAAFDELAPAGRFLLVKLIGGGFRVGVSKLLVQRALAEHAGLDARLVAQRMMGYADARRAPDAARFTALIAPAGAEAGADGRPLPFFLAHALQDDAATFEATLGPVHGWQVEWKYDGIRAQLVREGGRTWLWSRGEELIGERFPEVLAAAAGVSEGTVLDGELLVWHAGAPAPEDFQRLQQRIGRKTLGRKLLADTPVAFVAYDLLRERGSDLRALALAERRPRLEALLAGSPLRLAPTLAPADWAACAALRAGARARGFEGLMLKQRASRYGSGRTKSEGTWWKWKVDALAVDAVLVYAQAGHGRRAGVYTDYTFALWSRAPRDASEAQAVLDAIARREPAPPRDGGALQLLPVAKAYSGLSDAEFTAVDRVIRDTTLEKFGPVRSVRPTLVFEIGFEGVSASPRHKSGVAVRFPRMLRWRTDKAVWQADEMAALRALVRGA
jgi:DNA ligase-1